MKKFARSLVKKTKKAPEHGFIIWKNGVPMEKGNPFPVWDALPDPLVPQTPLTASTPHPWSERKLKKAAEVSNIRYQTILEVNELSTDLMTADQLLWHEQRAAMRARNTLVAHREWHRKLSTEQMIKQLPAYEALMQAYQDHLDNYKKLYRAFRILRSWVTRWRATKLVDTATKQLAGLGVPTTHPHRSQQRQNKRPSHKPYKSEPQIPTITGSMANLIRSSAVSGLVVAGVHRHPPDMNRHLGRSSTSDSRGSDISLD